MNARLLAAIGALTGGVSILTFSALLLQSHFAVLKDVQEYALPLAADIPPLERRLKILREQVELSELQASLRGNSAEEKLHVHVLPQGNDLKRMLTFLERTQTFLERRSLASSFAPIEIDEPEDVRGLDGLRSRSVRFGGVFSRDGRRQLHSILNMSGLLTVGDALSPEDIRGLFALMESQKYAGIVPVENFLSADLLGYVQNPTLHDRRLAQALSSDDVLASFKELLHSSRLEEAKDLLASDLGRTLVAQKLWPVQFLTIEKESLEPLPDGREKVDITVKAYSRK